MAARSVIPNRSITYKGEQTTFKSPQDDDNGVHLDAGQDRRLYIQDPQTDAAAILFQIRKMIPQVILSKLPPIEEVTFSRHSWNESHYLPVRLLIGTYNHLNTTYGRNVDIWAYLRYSTATCLSPDMEIHGEQGHSTRGIAMLGPFSFSHVIAKNNTGRGDRIWKFNLHFPFSAAESDHELDASAKYYLLLAVEARTLRFDKPAIKYDPVFLSYLVKFCENLDVRARHEGVFRQGAAAQKSSQNHTRISINDPAVSSQVLKRRYSRRGMVAETQSIIAERSSTNVRVHKRSKRIAEERANRNKSSSDTSTAAIIDASYNLTRTQVKSTSKAATDIAVTRRATRNRITKGKCRDGGETTVVAESGSTFRVKDVMLSGSGSDSEDVIPAVAPNPTIKNGSHSKKKTRSSVKAAMVAYEQELQAIKDRELREKHQKEVEWNCNIIKTVAKLQERKKENAKSIAELIEKVAALNIEQGALDAEIEKLQLSRERGGYV